MKASDSYALGRKESSFLKDTSLTLMGAGEDQLRRSSGGEIASFPDFLVVESKNWAMELKYRPKQVIVL